MKKKKSQYEFAKKKYFFDYTEEKNIYMYIFCNQIKQKIIDSLDDDLKFDTYTEWKQYIKNKYDILTNENLIDFDRYINQRLRDVKPRQEYWNFFIPVLISMLAVKFPDLIDVFEEISVVEMSFQVFITMMISLLIIAIMLFFVVLEMFRPLLDNNNDQNFLLDYKEIIDEMIEEREKRCKKKTRKKK